MKGGYYMPSNLPLKAKYSNTRYKILNSAYHLFLENGFSSTTFTDIVNASEVSSGGIRGYYKNPKEILASLALEILETLSNRIQLITNDESFTFQKKLSLLVDLAIANRESFSLLKEAQSVANKTPSMNSLVENIDTFRNQLFGFFKSAARQAEKAYPHLKDISTNDLAVLLFSCFEGIYLCELPSKAICTKETLDTIINFLLDC